MITVTESAAEYLKTASVGVERPENACFRLRVGQKGPDLAMDQTRPGDQVVQYAGEAILTIEPSVASEVSERTLDFDREKSRLVFTDTE